MPKTLLNIMLALIIGLIAGTTCLLLEKSGLHISPTNAFLTGLAAAAVSAALLTEEIRRRISYILNELDWAEESARLYQNIPAKYRQSFWILFGLINLAYLFHTINFFWGNEDWGAVRSAVNSTEGIKNGDFSAYWLQELLFNGKILPVANNLWSFVGLSLAGVLLGIYWNLPPRSTPVVIAGLMFAVTPYTLSILYHAKTALGLCWLPTIMLTALLLSEHRNTNELKTYCRNIVSVLMFLLALGTYAPSVSLAFIAILGQIFLKTTYADISIKDAAHRTLQGTANLCAALLIYVLILFLLDTNAQLSPETSSALNLCLPLMRLPLLLKYAVLQFALPLPFMGTSYKVIYGIAALTGLFTLIYKAPNAKAAARGLVLIPFLIIASLAGLLFCAAPEVQFARLSFFGLPFVGILFFIITIRLGGFVLTRLGYTLAVLMIFMNFVRIAYAEKVWKFGWEAETKLAERIITRLEKKPEFDINRQYRLLQIGSKSLRQKYYLKNPHEIGGGELLERAYYPAGAAKDAWNFFYQTDFLEKDADINEALQNPSIREYLLDRARPWPAEESLFINGNYIVMILSDTALAHIQQKLTEQK